jgi:hypothetical protein
MGTLFAHLTPEPRKRPRRSLLFRDVPAADTGDEPPRRLSPRSGRHLRADQNPADPKVIKAFAHIHAARQARRSAQMRAWAALMVVLLNLPPESV